MKHTSEAVKAIIRTYHNENGIDYYQRTTVKCNFCSWRGIKSDLILHPNGSPYGCPSCVTTEGIVFEYHTGKDIDCNVVDSFVDRDDDYTDIVQGG